MYHQHVQINNLCLCYHNVAKLCMCMMSHGEIPSNVIET